MSELENSSLPEILARLDEGDEDAANEIFSRYANRLIGLARTRLDSRLKQKVDPEDVVQSVFRSFFVRHSQGKFEFANWGSLWGLLAQLTLRKCGRRANNLHAACRDVRREMVPAKNTESNVNSWEAVTREPTAEEIVAFQETLESLFDGMDDVQREILELKLQNYKNVEIAEKIGVISERKVYRVLDKVKERLQEIVA